MSVRDQIGPGTGTESIDVFNLNVTGTFSGATDVTIVAGPSGNLTVTEVPPAAFTIDTVAAPSFTGSVGANALTATTSVTAATGNFTTSLATPSLTLASPSQALALYTGFGTWTPLMSIGGSQTGITFSTQVGTYSKIGRFVHVCFDLALSSKGSNTGNVVIGGYPFAAEGSNFYPGVVVNSNFTFTSGYSLLVCPAGATNMTQCGSGVAEIAVTDVNMANNTALGGNFSYIASS